MLPSLAVRESVVISSICCSKEPNTLYFYFLKQRTCIQTEPLLFLQYVYYTRFVDVNKFIISLLYPTNQHFLISTIKNKTYGIMN